MSTQLFKNKEGVSFNAPMARHTTMRVGGPASILYHPKNLNNLIDFVKLCNKKRISFLAIGGGSNIIIKDKGTKKALIKLSSEFFKSIEVCQNNLVCGAGASLNRLCTVSESRSLGGAEFLVGIPGTVGGAIAQNAGCYGRSISELIKDIKVLTSDGRIKTLKGSQINFGYRKSGLEKFIILSATLRLSKKSRADIKKNISRYIGMRLSSQDYTAPSAGCIFKNPKN